MIAFEVYHRGKKICTAGVGLRGVIAAHVTWVGRSKADPHGEEELSFSVGGLHSPTGEHRRWADASVAVGDEITVRVVKANRVDKPSSRKRYAAKSERKSKEDYVRRVANELGWKLDENGA